MNRTGKSTDREHNPSNRPRHWDRGFPDWGGGPGRADFFLDLGGGLMNKLATMFSPRNLLRRLGAVAVGVAMFSLVGGHWAVFQSIAWATMVRDFSREGSVAEAVGKTFSGKSPCPMCQTIVKERQKEQNLPVTVKVEKKAEFFVDDTKDIVPRPRVAGNFAFSPSVFFAPVRCDRPLGPVPRSGVLDLS